MSANVYYDPEKFGLRTVGEVDFSSGSYEFDTSVVWQDVETGQFYYADDSGCSCPTPFESVGRADLFHVDRPQRLIDYLERRKKDSYYYEDESPPSGDRRRLWRAGAEGRAVMTAPVPEHVTAAAKAAFQRRPWTDPAGIVAFLQHESLPLPRQGFIFGPDEIRCVAAIRREWNLTLLEARDAYNAARVPPTEPFKTYTGPDDGQVTVTSWDPQVGHGTTVWDAQDTRDLAARHQVAGPVVIRGEALEALDAAVIDGRPYPYELVLMVEGGQLKVKVNGGTWSVGYDGVEVGS